MKVIDRNDWMASRPWLDLDDADVAGYVAKVSDEADFDLESALHAWRRDGVVLFEDVVDRHLIDALVEDVAYLRRHHRDFDLLVEVRGEQKHIRDLTDEELEYSGLKFNSIHAISRAAAHLSLTPRVAVFLRHVFGDAPCAMQSLTFYKGSQQPIHIDYPYVRCQSQLAHLAASWIPLEDIAPASGPLAYYPGSHRPEVSDFFDWGGGSVLLEPDSTRTPIELSEHLADRMRVASIEPRVYCPRKGDALVWHGNLSHEGTAIADASLTRKSYVTHYTSLSAYPRAHLKPGAPEQGWIARENGGYVFEYSWLDGLRQLPSERLFTQTS
ncbi:phytanoyl-CoA dioxygenase family protein [Cognatilysobacter terrigena]|uniref:phytanoyl-CoA dioxygenase family protein n=1 Tax=Cognatilysobacter terrigena TaxID=2488749 RepID=UPI00105D01B4|nr:phytanoyl-CoA dioxygenase family protein [Lysobacter terrigena]